MKVAIIADIHANALALSAVLSAARTLGVDDLIVAGDLLGYYFQPSESIHLLQDWHGEVYVTRGNHEDMFLSVVRNQGDCSVVPPLYRPGIQVALRSMSESQIDWISRLPHPLLINIDGLNLLISHGSPDDINRYVYPDQDLVGLFPSHFQCPDILVMGHTHYPMIRRQKNSLVVNPGSVGQPRNRIPGAHWALLDTESMNVDLLVTSYNFKRLQETCIILAPDFPYLHEVLSRS